MADTDEQDTIVHLVAALRTHIAQEEEERQRNPEAWLATLEARTQQQWIIQECLRNECETRRSRMPLRRAPLATGLLASKLTHRPQTRARLTRPAPRCRHPLRSRTLHGPAVLVGRRPLARHGVVDETGWRPWRSACNFYTPRSIPSWCIWKGKHRRYSQRRSRQERVFPQLYRKGEPSIGHRALTNAKACWVLTVTILLLLHVCTDARAMVRSDAGPSLYWYISVATRPAQKTFGFPAAHATIFFAGSQAARTIELRHLYAHRIACDDHEATPLAQRKTRHERSCTSRTASRQWFSSVTCRPSATI